MSENNGQEFKQVLLAEANEKGEMRLHVGSDNEAILALALRKLDQAINYHMAMKARKEQSVIQANPQDIAKANSIINRMRGN